jgi:hypothetical protein
MRTSTMNPSERDMVTTLSPTPGTPASSNLPEILSYSDVTTGQPEASLDIPPSSPLGYHRYAREVSACIHQTHYLPSPVVRQSVDGPP